MGCFEPENESRWLVAIREFLSFRTLFSIIQAVLTEILQFRNFIRGVISGLEPMTTYYLVQASFRKDPLNHWC